MGLTNLIGKIVLSIGFLLTAVVVYTLGAQRNSIELGLVEGTDKFNFIPTAIVRQNLVTAVESDAMSESSVYAKQLAILSPLDELPYEAALANSISRGDAKSAQKFANFTLTRQPRSLAARLYLFGEAATLGDNIKLIKQYERLVELRSLNRHVLSDALVGAFRESEDWSSLLEFLNSNPPTSGILIDRLIREPNVPPEFENVLIKYPSKQTRYLNRVIRDDGLKAAFQTWHRFSQLSETDSTSLPFNSDLRIRPEPAPFNWSIKSSMAELQQSGGLYVSFPGKDSPLFINQILAAPSGTYTLRSEAIGRMPKHGGSLEWRLTCADGGDLLATLALSLQSSSTIEAYETTAQIPPDSCEFQRLELVGVAGAFPKTSRTEILSVSLTALTSKDN